MKRPGSGTHDTRRHLRLAASGGVTIPVKDPTSLHSDTGFDRAMREALGPTPFESTATAPTWRKPGVQTARERRVAATLQPILDAHAPLLLPRLLEHPLGLLPEQLAGTLVAASVSPGEPGGMTWRMREPLASEWAAEGLGVPAAMAAGDIPVEVVLGRHRAVCVLRAGGER